MKQLEFLDKPTDQILLEKMEKLEEKYDALRKSLYARNSAVNKKTDIALNELNILRNAMCQSKSPNEFMLLIQ